MHQERPKLPYHVLRHKNYFKARVIGKTGAGPVVGWWLCFLFRAHQVNILAVITCMPALIIQPSASRPPVTKISGNLEAARNGFRGGWSLWNLTGGSAVVLPSGLSNFRAIRSFQHKSRGCETSRDLVVICLTPQWKKAQEDAKYKGHTSNARLY